MLARFICLFLITTVGLAYSLKAQIRLGIQSNLSLVDTSISYGGIGPELSLELPVVSWCALSTHISYMAQVPRAEHARYCALIRPAAGLRVGPFKNIPDIAIESGFSIITTQFYSRPVEILPGVEFPKTYSHWTNNYWYYSAHYHFKEKWAATVSYTYPVSMDFEIPYRQPMILLGVRYRWVYFRPLFEKRET